MGVIMKNGVMYGQMNNADGIHVTDTLGVLGVVDADVILQDLIDAMADSVADVTVSGSNIVITMLDGTTTNLIAISNTAASGSSDLITSGGVYSEVQELNADLASKQSLLQVTQSISGGYLYNNYYSVS